MFTRHRFAKVLTLLFVYLSTCFALHSPPSETTTLLATNATSSECINPPRDNCSFYSNCLESQYNCGLTGYPIGYGEKFCQRFSDQRSTLSQRGQTWMLDTMQCLQNALVSDVVAGTAHLKTCRELEDKAFDSHAPCYLQSGLCKLPLSDWFAILRIVKFKTLFQSWDAFEATLEAGKGCL